MAEEWCDAVSPWMGKPGKRVRRACTYRVQDHPSRHSWAGPPFRGLIVMGPDEDPDRVDVIDQELPEAEGHVPWPHGRADEVTE